MGTSLNQRGTFLLPTLTRKLGAILVIMHLGACDLAVPPDLSAPELQRFDSEQALRDYLATHGADAGRDGPQVFLMPTAGQAVPDADSGAAEAGGFSVTNVQEQGVGESDVVQTDGTYLYVLDDSRLHIVQAMPADHMEHLSTIELGHSLNDMYLHGNLAVILGTRLMYVNPPDMPDVGAEPLIIGFFDVPFHQSPLSVVTVLDVSDARSPRVVTTYEFESSLFTTRLIDDTLYLVLQSYPRPLPLSGAEQPQPTTDEVLPDLAIRDADGNVLRRNLVEWSDIYRPAQQGGLLLTTVVSLNVQDPAVPPNSVAVFGSAGTVYVSRDAMYIAEVMVRAVPWGPLTSAAPDTTAIYQLALDQDRGAALLGRGAVPGRVLDRFSMSAHDGHLRVATTTRGMGGFAGGDAVNNVYVLRLKEQQLGIVGRVEGIAPGEQIFSARFVGDRGFLVTFKNIDPLFTLDLADPEQPRVVGELKVPGYSDYIHLLGNDHLLTIGKDAIDMGDFAWYQGVQISVFDVSDFADPRQVDVEIVGDRGTESEALHNPHAFNYYKPLDLLAVPMIIAEKPPHAQQPQDWGRPVFSGLCIYHVSPQAGIELQAQIATADSAAPYGSRWTRGVVMSDHIFAVTPQRILALAVEDLSAVPQRLDLPGAEPGPLPAR